MASRSVLMTVAYCNNLFLVYLASYVQGRFCPLSEDVGKQISRNFFDAGKKERKSS